MDEKFLDHNEPKLCATTPAQSCLVDSALYFFTSVVKYIFFQRLSFLRHTGPTVRSSGKYQRLVSQCRFRVRVEGAFPGHESDSIYARRGVSSSIEAGRGTSELHLVIHACHKNIILFSLQGPTSQSSTRGCPEEKTPDPTCFSSSHLARGQSLDEAAVTGRRDLTQDFKCA